MSLYQHRICFRLVDNGNEKRSLNSASVLKIELQWMNLSLLDTQCFQQTWESCIRTCLQVVGLGNLIPIEANLAGAGGESDHLPSGLDDTHAHLGEVEVVGEGTGEVAGDHHLVTVFGDGFNDNFN